MIILDTCALLWLAQGSTRLSTNVRDRIDRDGIVAISAVSAFEIALKYRAGKLKLPVPAEDWWRRAVEHHRIDVIGLDADLMMAATRLPPVHRDPADRFIIATALAQDAPVVTSEERFSVYGVSVLS